MLRKLCRFAGRAAGCGEWPVNPDYRPSTPPKFLLNYRVSGRPSGPSRDLRGKTPWIVQGLIIVLIVIGAIAGWLAGMIVNGIGFGLIGNIIVGIVGAFIGGWLLPRLGVMIGGGDHRCHHQRHHRRGDSADHHRSRETGLTSETDFTQLIG